MQEYFVFPRHAHLPLIDVDVNVIGDVIVTLDWCTLNEFSAAQTAQLS